MPSPNIVKEFIEDGYYHIYNRGVHGQNIFIHSTDYAAFLNIFKRHLSNKAAQDNNRRTLPHYKGQVELLAYCLMPSHFHLLVYNVQQEGITRLMRSLTTAYSLYFNKSHHRKGSLFETTYKAKFIADEPYLWHISRYIHLNPQDIGAKYELYPYSSYPYYIAKKKAEWLKPQRILDMHNEELDNYPGFVKDYETMRSELHDLKKYLANS